MYSVLNHHPSSPGKVPHGRYHTAALSARCLEVAFSFINRYTISVIDISRRRMPTSSHAKTTAAVITLSLSQSHRLTLLLSEISVFAVSIERLDA
jgi:hypothetical protein